MLHQPTIEKLIAMRLQGMVDGLEAIEQGEAAHDLSFAEKLALILAHKRSLGKRLTKAGAMLHLLDGYLLSCGVPSERQITSADLVPLDAFGQ